MPMITTVTFAFEGAAACIDCQRNGIPVCAHIGFNPEAWVSTPGSLVQVPGLDLAFEHVVTDVEISGDRKTLTLTVETRRPPMLDLARHLSTVAPATPKAMVRAIHAETGEVLAEGGYDAPLREGQEVWIGGAPHVVETVAHPNRHPEHGTVADGLFDWQEAQLRPLPAPEPVTRAREA